MLLELLKHHEDLFMAVIEPFIGARKAADLARLAATCRQLRLFVGTIPFYNHCVCFRWSLKNIKSMNTLSNEYCSIKEYNNDLHMFRYDPAVIWSRRVHLLEDNYYIRTIKRRIFYRIRCTDRISIIKNNDAGGVVICINGPVPLWINKYPIYIMDKALQCYTFTV